MERLAELRNRDLFFEEAVEDLKQRVLEDEFNVGVSGGTTQKAHRKQGGQPLTICSWTGNVVVE